MSAAQNDPRKSGLSAVWFLGTKRDYATAFTISIDGDYRLPPGMSFLKIAESIRRAT